MSQLSKSAKVIFLMALDVAPSGRAALLDVECGEDTALRRHVEALLKVHDEPDSLLDSPRIDLGIASVVTPENSPTDIRPITEQLGDTFGPYKLLQQIGEGGMGSVFMAEQAKPVERRVAVKIIKPGMDSQQVIARFEAERQALAMMDHPNIAKVLDAGTTETGRPYFVMELVKGMPVTQYCDEQHLSPRERLELFMPICQAVQHAHQKGIIHRDLKPSNILIAQYDNKAVPKIIDFGVAKAISHKLTEKTMFTQYGQIVGTIEYMSPEQARFNQLDVDTRSDIYSLGVLLYELLTGETPFDKQRLRSAAFDELLRIIREEEPPKPSTKLSSSARLASTAINRKMEPKKLSLLVRGDLDRIVMKALEKNRNRRYDAANALASDIQHYLSDEPVTACPPSAGYKFRKFARRNKFLIGTSAAVAATLIAGIIGTSWQAYRATKAEGLAAERLKTVEAQKSQIELQKEKAVAEARRADQEAARANEEATRAKKSSEVAIAVNDFLNSDLLQMASVEQQVLKQIPPDPDIKLRTLLDRAALKISDRFQHQPLVEAELRWTLGASYEALGQPNKAEIQYQRSKTLFDEHLQEDSQAALNVSMNIANILSDQGRFQEAEDLSRETISRLQKTLGENSYEALMCTGNLGNVLRLAGKFREAEELERTTIERLEKNLGKEHALTLKIKSNYAATLLLLHRYEDAEHLLRETYTQQQEALPPDHPDMLMSKWTLIQCLQVRGQNREAEELQTELVECMRNVHGPDHPRTLGALNNLGTMFVAQEKHQAAESIYREILRLSGDSQGPEDPLSAKTMTNLAFVLSQRGQLLEAERLVREALAIQHRIGGRENPDAIIGYCILSVILRKTNRAEEAESLLRDELELAQIKLGAENQDVMVLRRNLAITLGDRGKHHEAKEVLNGLIALEEKVRGNTHPETLGSKYELAGILLDEKQYKEAESLYRSVWEQQKEILGENDVATLNSMGGLLLTLRALNKHQETEQLARELIDLIQLVHGPDDEDLLRIKSILAHSLTPQHKFEEAIKLYRQNAEDWKRLGKLDESDRINCLHNLVYFLLVTKQYGEAERTAADLLPRMQEINGSEHLQTLWLKSMLARSLCEQGRVEEGETAFRETISSSQKLIASGISNQELNSHPFNYTMRTASYHLSWETDPERRSPDLALLLADFIVQTEPDSEWNWQVLGWARYRKGLYRESIQALEKAMQINGHGGDHFQWLFLAMAHQHLGEQEKAREYYEKSLVLTTGNNSDRRPEILAIRDEVERELELEMTDALRQEIVNKRKQESGKSTTQVMP